MDFLDPKKQRRHTIMLYSGYVLIGIAILIATIVLVYQANGFGVNGKGQVVQNGLVFFSSQPNPADIYLDGKRNDKRTNARLNIPAGSYDVRLAREGYHDWSHRLTVLGGDVQSYEYPFLFPKQYDTSVAANYEVAPALASQSRDRRWLLVQPQANAAKFDVYDITDETLESESIEIPATIATASAEAHTWQAVQWANNSQFILLKHSFGQSVEYILLNRANAAESVNLSKAWGVTPASVTLIDNRHDQYHLFMADGTLSRATLEAPTPVTVLEKVLNYKSYGTKQILYVTSEDSAEGRVQVKILNGDKSYPVRELSANTTYVLDMAEYRGKQYVVAGAGSENVVYVYENPIQQLNDPDLERPNALRAIRVAGATYVEFSPSTRYIMAQKGTTFGVYDIYLKDVHVYTINSPLDAPQAHANWMDGARLTYVTGGKQIVFDYDGQNYQTMVDTNVALGGYFSRDYDYFYGFAANEAAASVLNQTALRTPADR